MLLCVHPSLSLCMFVDAFVHVSACIFIVHAGPEAAVLCRLAWPRSRFRILARG